MRSALSILETDAQFLSCSGLIDYSLILGEVKVQDVDELREFIEDNPTTG